METLKIPDPSLVLLIGSSGAGKSTFAARHFLPTEIVSSDRCRAMICDDESDQGVTPGAFRLLHHITRLRLVSRRLTVIDATNLLSSARRPLLWMAKESQIPVVALVFHLPLETCLARNRARPDRFVPEPIIAEQTLELPQILPRLEREGYWRIYAFQEVMLDQITIVRLKENYQEKLETKFILLKKC